MDARRQHRRIASLLGILLLGYWAVSGLVICTWDLLDPDQGWAVMGGGPGARAALDSRVLPPLPDPRTLREGVAKALGSAGGLAVASIDLRMVHGRARLQLAGADGSRDTALAFDAASGQPLAREQSYDLSAGLARAARRDRVKSWHKGDIAGLPGQAVALLAAAVLATLVATGATLFLRLRRASERAGRGSAFWTVPRESRWRRVHRWVAVVAAVFLLNTALTGLVLESGEILVQLAIRYHLGRPPYPMPTPMPPVSQAPLPAGQGAALEATWQAARQAAPGSPVVALQLVERGGHVLALATLAGEAGRVLAFDDGGRPVHDGIDHGVQQGNGYFADWHQVVKRMHRGDIIGVRSGRWVAWANGLALLYLVSSGLAMILRTRRAAP